MKKDCRQNPNWISAQKKSRNASKIKAKLFRINETQTFEEIIRVLTNS